MRGFPCIVALAFLAGASVAAVAAEQTISQKGKLFSATEVSIKKGDTLVFVNDDNVAHNIFSTSAGNDFNLGSQQPGKSVSVTFDKPGDIDIMCAIHPLMKMKVKVAQ
jgi:plastocyanin